MTQVFELAAPDDLVHPKKGSMTARALVSYGQRSLFERRHEVLAPALEGTIEHRALARWLAVVAGMLPGNPHAVARSLRDPAVALPARRLLERRGDLARHARAFVGSAFLWLELEGALSQAVELPFEVEAVALGHGVRTARPEVRFGAGTHTVPIPKVEGRLCAIDRPGSFSEGAVIGAAPFEASRVATARKALLRISPGDRDDLDRLVQGFVVGVRGPEPLPVGLVCLGHHADVADDVRAIVSAVVTEKLALLALGGPLADDPAALTTLAVEAAVARSLGIPFEARARALELRPHASPLGCGVLDELAQT